MYNLLNMKDSHIPLYFKEKYLIKLNRNTDDMFIMCDYDRRDYLMNMNLQHYHDFYEIFIPLETNVAHLVESRYYSLMQNDIVLLKPNSLHMSVYPKLDGGCRRLIIDFRLGKGISGLEHEMKKLLSIFDSNVPILRFPPDIKASVIENLNSLFIIGKNKQNGWEIAFYASFMEFLSALYRNAPYNIYSENKGIESKEQKIYYIQDYINTHYRENLTLDSIAQEFAISPYYLSHIFKSMAGLNFVNYIQSIRVRNALQALAYSDESISGIIENCGFTSASQFNRVFHQFLGISPSAFRKSHEKKKLMFMGYMNPESEEKAPAHFQSSLNIRQKMKLAKKGAMKVGLRAEDLGLGEMDMLKARLNTLDVDTIELDIPRTFNTKDYISLTQRLLAQIKEKEFDISLLKCKINPSSPSEREWKYDIDNFRKALYTAKFLFSPAVTTTTGEAMEEDRDEKFNRLISTLTYLLPYAEESGVKIALEPRYGDTINSALMLERLFSTLSSPSLSLIFNPVALLSPDGSENTYEFYDTIVDIYGEKFTAMHISDTLNGESVPLGQGIMAKSYPHIARALRLNIPLIRTSSDRQSLEDDILFIRRTFS